jgi:uncharacterized protein (DUF58 family)
MNRSAWGVAVERHRPILRAMPERRLAIAIAIASVLWLVPGRVGTVLALAALAGLALATIADWLMLPGRRDLSVARELPPTVGAGDLVEGEYVVTSRWPRTLLVRVIDELPTAVRGGAPPTELPLAPLDVARLRFAVEGRERGQHALGRIALVARTRLGLLSVRSRVDPGDEILVAPSVSAVRRFRLLAMQNRLDAAGVRALRLRGEGSAFAGLREYAIGDDPRRIDWKATAHRGKPIVREFTIERAQTVFVFIDCGRAMTQLAGDLPRLEHALSAALVLTDVAATAGDRVGALAFDDEVRAYVAPQRGRAALAAIRRALHPVRATLAEPDYASAFRYFATRQRRRALVVFFTDVIDERASRALIAHVSRSAARHLVVVVALRNDAVFAMADAAPGGLAAAGDDDAGRASLPIYERAAAEELIVGREEALERMRRAGVVVLDVSPAQMTAAVVNRYLEIKARGAL